VIAPVRAAEAGLIGCHVCGLVVAVGDAEALDCPRCDSDLRQRKPKSISRAWALLCAGLVCYVPANVLPVMHTMSLGDTNGGDDSTIMSGVIQFWQNGSEEIAVLIFLASILIPSTKFIVLAILLVSAGRRRSGRAVPARSVGLVRLYRLLEIIGYWSMLDVLVVGLVTAVVQFPGVSEAEPRLGIFYFGMVVILTILATQSFDPRLLWDRRQEPAS
jgi:paraquat-inducible protein A